MHSDIFNSYLQEGIKKGWIKSASAEDGKVPLQTRNNPKTDIEFLYGNKFFPDRKDVIDESHPKSVILFPAYDKVNGLIENVKERQQIMVDLALRPPNGKLVNHRYVRASQSLTDDLIKIAMIADNNGQSELAKLADHCLNQLHKKAIAPLVIAGLIAGAIAAIGIFNNFGQIDQGVITNSQKAIEEVQQFIKSAPSISRELSNLVEGLKYLNSIANTVAQEGLESLPKGMSKENIVNIAHDYATSDQGKKLMDDLDKFEHVCKNMAELLTSKFIPLIDATSPQDQENHYDITALLLKGWHLLFPEEKKNVISRLQTLVGSLNDAVGMIAKRRSATQNYVNQNKEEIIDKLKNIPPKEEPKPEKAVEEIKPAIDKLTLKDKSQEVGSALWST